MMKFNISPYFLVGLLALALFTAAFYRTGREGCIPGVQQPNIERHSARNEDRKTGKEEQAILYHKEETPIKNDTVMSCDVFTGRWVFDNVSHPLYKEQQCSFMMEKYTEFACEKYGRKDTRYKHWRWQPRDCDLPRFNATELMEKMRGKRLVFVGDSLGRNQWTSLLCLIEPSLSRSSRKSFSKKDNSFIFQATEYNSTIEFYWSPFLVESNGDDPFHHKAKVGHILRITSIEKHARHWNDADILIFDSFAWWMMSHMTILWGSFGSSDAIYKKVEERMRCFELTLSTWSNWVEININRTKTKLFFTSPLPHHYGDNWSRPKCYNETEPYSKLERGGLEPYRQMMHITESVMQKLETRGIKVRYLNVTALTYFRKDGHETVYKKLFNNLHSQGYADCLHWCLPGVPDVWNEILYTYIVNSL